MPTQPTTSWRIVVLLFAVCLVGGASACGDGGGDSGVFSCTMAVSVGTQGGTKMCEEGPASMGQQLQQACSLSGGSALADAGAGFSAHFSNGPCSHAGALGACQMTSGGMTVAMWYYGDASSGMTSDDVKQMCSLAGAAYLKP